MILGLYQLNQHLAFEDFVLIHYNILILKLNGGIFMENTNNKRSQELLKDMENAFSEYARTLANGLEDKSISIDDIEAMLLNAMARIKKGFMNYTQDRIVEEDKKKLK